MTFFLRAVTSLPWLVLMAGCDQTSAPAPTSAKAVEDALKVDLEQMEAGIRIAAANKRIDELERQVGALQATPEKLDLSLLTARVATLEAKAGDDASSPEKPSGQTTSGVGQGPRSEMLSDTPRQVQRQTPKLSLPELETRK
jgi:hypothetical protein